MNDWQWFEDYEAAALETVNPLRNPFRKQLRGKPSLLQHPREDKWTLGGFAYLKGGGIDPTALGKAFRRRGGHTVFEGLSRRRALALLLQIWLTMRQPSHADHQPAGRTCAVNAGVTEPQGGEIAAH